MNKLYMSDHFFEALFRQAVTDNFNRELAKIPSEEELSETITFSPRHVKRMKKLFVNDNRKEQIKSSLILLKKIVAIIIITTSILFGLLMTVPSVRAAVSETLILWFDKFTKFISRPAGSESKIMEPSYIPEGYVESKRVEVDNFLSIVYTNNSGDLLYFTAIGDSISLDNENREYIEMTIENINYHIFDGSDSEKESDITWEYGGFRYLINAQFSKEQLIKIALSVN